MKPKVCFTILCFVRERCLLFVKYTSLFNRQHERRAEREREGVRKRRRKDRKLATTCDASEA